MAELKWDELGQRFYEAGVDRGVLYPNKGSGVVWNGLVSIDETPSGGENRPHYIDGVKYYNETVSSEFKASLEAFTYPDEFAELNGSSRDLALSFEDQPRQEFGLSYRTLVGSDVDSDQLGYKIHIIYNATASSRKSSYATISNQKDPSNFSWDITARPVFINGFKPTAHIIWDSTKVGRHKTEELERILYGSKSSDAKLPSIEQLMAINHWGSSLQINENINTGIAPLTYMGLSDLTGDVSSGIYSKHTNSRLVPTSTPGIYKIGT